MIRAWSSAVVAPVFAALVALAAFVPLACGSSKTQGFDDDPGADGGGDGNTGVFMAGDTGVVAPDSGKPPVVITTVYANTDDSLYSLDPATKKVTLIGKLTGAGGGTDDVNITDCAVDITGVVWVNTPTVVYKTKLPAGGTGDVVLTKVATIAAKTNQRFYALGFAPAGVLGTTETLVGGDGNGELWAIDTSSGATTELGGFGPDKTRVFALSGDVVFYTDAAGKATGLATVRSCLAGGTSCTTTGDFLAGIDMTALVAAYKSGTPAKSLLAGIYGGSASSKGAGVGFGDLFGLGAWEGTVFAFQRGTGGAKSPSLLTVDTKSGVGTLVDSSFTFTNGWSGAGVSTTVVVDVPPPPPAPN